jgi:hypothetical protein
MASEKPPPINYGMPVTPRLLEWLGSQNGGSGFETVRDLIVRRHKFGLQKYGQVLMSLDGRDAVVDALEKVGDLLQYTFKACINLRRAEVAAALEAPLAALQALIHPPDNSA